MQTNKLSLSLISSAFLLYSTSQTFIDIERIFDEQIEFFENMKKDFTEHNKKVQSQVKISVPVIDVKELDKENKVVITIKGIKADTIEATLNPKQDGLAIVTATEKINVSVKDRMLTIEMSQQHVQESNEKDKSDDKKDERVQAFTMYGSSRIGQWVKYPLNLAQQDIQYNKNNSELVINIPYIEKAKGTPIPITIVEQK